MRHRLRPAGRFGARPLQPGGMHGSDQYADRGKSRSEPRHNQHILCGAFKPHDQDAHGRFTRLTNAFSKKAENDAHAVALHVMYCNFVRIHKTLRTTPAMAAGITKRLWEISDVVDVVEAWENSNA
jgi:hypothetical protein